MTTSFGEERMLIDGVAGAVLDAVRCSTPSIPPPRRSSGSPPTRRETTPSAPWLRPGVPSTTSTWSTDVALRVRCLRQLQAAMRSHAEELRAMTIAETGSPLFMTRSAQLDDPVESLGWVADLAESYEWTTDLGRAEPLGMPARRWMCRDPAGVVAAITPVERPPPDQPGQAGPGPRRGQHRHPQARPRHAVVRDGARPAHRRGDRHPCRLW